MRLAFFGTPDFSVAALQALVDAGHTVARVYSRAPQPAGRGRRLRNSPVHACADALGLPVATPATLRDPQVQVEFAALAVDAAVVVAYGLILPAAVLAAPRLGCLNIHASLLPRWRGAAPIQHAILAGDAETGVTVMRLDEGLDTGPILLARRIAIGDDDAGTLHDRLAALGAEAIVAALAARGLDATPQPDGATYAPKLTAADEALDWHRPAAELRRRIRALSPRPGAHLSIDGERWKVLAAEPAPGDGVPGTVLDDRLTIACGDGALRPTRLQRPGKRAMAARQVLNGRPVTPGTRLE